MAVTRTFTNNPKDYPKSKRVKRAPLKTRLKRRIAAAKTQMRSRVRRARRTAARTWGHYTGTGTVASAHRSKSGAVTVRTHTRAGRTVTGHTRAQ